MEMGTKIKRAREKQNVSLQNLARQLEFPLDYLKKIESNTIDPKIGTLERICEALKIEVFSLFIHNASDKETKLGKTYLPLCENDEMVQVTPDVEQPKEITEIERLVNDFKQLYSRGYRFFDKSKDDDIGHSLIKHNEDGSFTGYTKNGLKKAAENGLHWDGKELNAEDIEMIFNAIVFAVNHNNFKMSSETDQSLNQFMPIPKT
ncbi:helix-turn-helix domain-containing protein [[Brevibacterium] frigoritolerans]|nr:helix-turn-helix domain-containing protein [Peribacillus frigoritolerans]